jgi:hypothetical protein
MIEFDVKPKIIPFGWTEKPWGEGYCFQNNLEMLAVILTPHDCEDGKRWIHFSISHRFRIPNWEELVRCKEYFIGADIKAIQVLPCRKEYVNINPRVLHLFACMDGDGLPDFTRGTGSL